MRDLCLSLLYRTPGTPPVHMRSDSSSSITGYGGARPKQHSRSTGSKRSSFCSEGDGGGVGYPGGNQVNKVAFNKIKVASLQET